MGGSRFDWGYLFEKLGQKVSTDFADKIVESTSEVRAIIDEAEEFAGKLRDIGPFVRPLRCEHCQDIIRPGVEHRCEDVETINVDGVGK